MEKQLEFTEQENSQIFEFVKQYDSFNNDIKVLEASIKDLLNAQEVVLIRLGETRKDEEDFFNQVSERTGLHVSQLKKMAQSLVMNLTNE
jgi:hypothetical protein